MTSAAQTFRPITGPSTWTAASFKSKADFTMSVPPAVQQDLNALVESGAFDGLPLTEITLERFGKPTIKALMDDIQKELWDGRGFLILQGLPVSGWSVERIEAYYWLLSLYLGKPVSQSAAGDRLGRVQDRSKPGVSAGSRGYTSRRQLPLHTDVGDFMGLLNVRVSKEGGMSLAVSVPTVYNAMAKVRPDLLEILFRGFPFHRRNEQQPEAELVTPYPVPVLGWAAERISAFYVRPSVELAYKELGREMDSKEVEALDLFDDLCWSDENLVKFMMEPGDIYFANNLTTLHGRTEFVDHDEEEKKRLSLRIWLQREPRTPVPPNQIVFKNPSGDLGVDAKPGGKPAGEEFLIDFKRKTAEASR
ncbi:MAG: TauD/TfdA family dioxygenase [Ottowia sp.]|uniref:TauD/TfdA family dioxygenase n=1 Tax=Ottowia sp. TaxID=1898956 RepID=UPI003C78AB69